LTQDRFQSEIHNNKQNNALAVAINGISMLSLSKVKDEVPIVTIELLLTQTAATSARQWQTMANLYVSGCDVRW